MILTGWLLLAAGAAVPTYAYGVYPLLLWILGRLRRSWSSPEAPPDWPSVTLTVPVYNEEDAIGDTLNDILALDYPRERLQILVISDCSTDRTDEIVRGYRDKGVELMRLPARGGKTVAENASRAHVRGEIVVNIDATISIDPSGVKALVAPFADPTVGIVSGRDISVSGSAADANTGEADYVGYEMWVRDLETRTGGIVGASGCFFAARRDLHSELVPAALSRDFAAPLIAREQGYRSVSTPLAVCYVPRTPSWRREYLRKVRTMARGLETLFYKRHLLNPMHYGAFAWKLASHKLARWLVPWAVIAAVVGVTFLALHHTVFRIVAGVAVLGLLLVPIGMRWPHGRRMPRIVSLPLYVALAVGAGVEAWVRALRRELNPIWEPTRRGASAHR